MERRHYWHRADPAGVGAVAPTVSKNRHVALLRGINVGGHNIVTRARLRGKRRLW
jgi:hypothetical protein